MCLLNCLSPLTLNGCGNPFLDLPEVSSCLKRSYLFFLPHCRQSAWSYKVMWLLMTTFLHLFTPTLIHINLWIATGPEHKQYCEKHLITHPNHWIQVLYPLPWSQVYNIKHLRMKNASTNICSWSQEVSGFQWIPYIQQVQQLKYSSLINFFFKSPVSWLVIKLSRLVIIAPQPWSSSPLNIT